MAIDHYPINLRGIAGWQHVEISRLVSYGGARGDNKEGFHMAQSDWLDIYVSISQNFKLLRLHLSHPLIHLIGRLTTII